MFHVNRDLYNAQVTAFPNSLVLCHLVPSSPIASQTKEQSVNIQGIKECTGTSQVMHMKIQNNNCREQEVHFTSTLN